MAKQAVDEIATGDGSKCEFRQIKDLSQQVVAGIMYYGTVKHVCDGIEKECQLKIWSQPWRNFVQFDWECPDDVSRVKRQVPGGAHPISNRTQAEILARQEVTKKIYTGDNSPHQ